MQVIALITPEEWASTQSRLALLETINHQHQEIHMALSDTVTALEAQVSETTGVTQSAIVLIEGIRAELAAIADELAAQGASTTRIESAIATLDAQEQALAAAVAVNPAPPVA